jgi:ATP-dependent exoDNAse (exonuclease V) alpha subunit
MLVRPATAYFSVNGVRCRRTQVLLAVAFALTVHKTQGLTLDKITVSLDSGMFAPGHAYTAMSRARAWHDVDISSLDLEAFAVDREAIAEYSRLEAL